MHNQHKQYVILTIVLLACGASVFFGVRSILHSNDEVTTFSVGDWEGITLPRYNGPAIYSTTAPRAQVVSLPNVSSSSNTLFHHHAVMSYNGGKVAAPQAQMSSTAHKIYQTSDQHVRSFGSGAGAGGNTITGTTSYSSSSTSTYNIPHIALALPSVRTRTLANNNIYTDNLATSSVILADASTPARTPLTRGLRRKPSDPGGEEAVVQDSEGWWYWDGEEWVPATTKIENGKVYVWEMVSPGVWDWVYEGDQADPDAPIGDIPFILLLICAAAYSVHRVRKNKTVTNL